MAGDAERSDEFEREVLSAINPALAVVGFWGATVEKVSENKGFKPNTCWWVTLVVLWALWAAVVMLVGDGADCPQGTLKKKKDRVDWLVLEWGSRMYACVWWIFAGCTCTLHTVAC